MLGYVIICLVELYIFLKYWIWIVVIRVGGLYVGELKFLDIVLSIVEYYLWVIKVFMKWEVELLVKV